MKKENILTRQVLIEKSPEEFSVIIFSGFTERWYLYFMGISFVVRQCMSEEDMNETNFYGYKDYYKVIKGNYNGCVIHYCDCYRLDDGYCQYGN